MLSLYKKDELTPAERDKHFMAFIISIIFFVLGLVLAPVCYVQGNKFLVFVSLGYSVLFLTVLVQLHFSKSINYFYVVSFGILYILQILYVFTGGQDGFGIIWIIVLPLFTIYMLNGIKSFLFANLTSFLFLIVMFWTPLFKYAYPFNQTFRIRFPILFLIECIFAAAIKFRLGTSEKNQAETLKNLTDLKNNLDEKVSEQTEQLKMANTNLEKQVVEMMTTLAATIDARDKYTSGHSKRVAEYSKLIAKSMGKSEKEQEDIYLVGLLHDIGKIGVPDEIINKTTKLTDEEFFKLKEHPSIGYEILKNMKTMPVNIVIGAHWHHERYDGKGYPDGLKGEEIPEFVRIISVADSYDAMTSNRSYRCSLSQSKVREEIVNGKGTQFDPEIAEVMIKLIDADTGYKMHG